MAKPGGGRAGRVALGLQVVLRGVGALGIGSMGTWNSQQLYAFFRLAATSLGPTEVDNQLPPCPSAHFFEACLGRLTS